MSSPAPTEIETTRNESNRQDMGPRVHPRFTCRGVSEVTTFDPSMILRGEIVDISRTGCFVATNAYVKSGLNATGQVKFYLDGKRFTSYVIVRSLTPRKGIGLEFTALEPVTAAQLEALIAALEKAQAESSPAQVATR